MKPPGLHKLLSLLTVVIGVLLMTYMIHVEDEPGAIPLLLIVSGTGWYLVARAQNQSNRK